ncbi:uncharacterized protein C21orf58 homolog [Antennarius striatus]|uniref:uncharacterized protein C21orf58 homolog n=1 Tax=Antennarius striatus TaxID=241820 RepID=UPI0035B41A79
MQRFQHDSALVDQVTRLKLKLLRKRLANKKQNMDNRAESARSATSYDGQLAELHSALRRKQDLLQRLKQQHILEELHRPHTWGGSQRQYESELHTAPEHPPLLSLCQPAPVLSFLQHPPLVPPQPPHIIHQTLPHHPPTNIQLTPQQPLTTQIPSPQLNPAPQSGGIQKGMVELMLLQNAQMHQTIMHNMMLKSMPLTATSPPRRPHHCANPTKFQMSNQEVPSIIIIIIIITMVQTPQHHSCLPSASQHGCQQCHLSQQNKERDTNAP